MSTYQLKSWQTRSPKSSWIAVTLQLVPVFCVAAGMLFSFIAPTLGVILIMGEFLWGLGYLYIGKPSSFFLSLGCSVVFATIASMAFIVTIFMNDTPNETGRFIFNLVLFGGLIIFLVIQLYMAWKIWRETLAYNNGLKLK